MQQSEVPIFYHFFFFFFGFSNFNLKLKFWIDRAELHREREKKMMYTSTAEVERMMNRVTEKEREASTREMSFRRGVVTWKCMRRAY